MSQHQKQQKILKGLTKDLVNAYVCSNLHFVITKNVDNGFIPQAIGCPKCKMEAFSMNYSVNQEFKPEVEWYKPTEGEIQAAELKMDAKQTASNRDYILKGGLISREVKLKSFTDEK